MANNKINIVKFVSDVLNGLMELLLKKPELQPVKIEKKHPAIMKSKNHFLF